MSFSRVLQPRSIAVFGGREAEEVIRQCDRMQYLGEIWPVHPSKTEILGHKVYRSVEELPGSPDAAYVAVNRHLSIDIVRALAERGAGGAVCFATGYGEAGGEGVELQRRLLEASGDMPLLGPNCYGMLNYVDGAMLWPDQQGGSRVERGVAIVTMSSNVAFNLTMQRRGLPVSYVLSLGNKLKFDLHDAISTFAQQERVSAIGLYIEGISDPCAFEAAIAVARKLGKPVVALKSGRSAAAQKMALSHTASLSGSDELMNLLFERTGVARVHSLEALVEALKVLHLCGPLSGNRLGVMSTSGGDLSLIGDALEHTDLLMPALSPEGTERLAATLHERVVVGNPLDYQMFDWNDQPRMAETIDAFMADGFDMTISLLDFPRADLCDTASWEIAERALVQAAQRCPGKAAVMATLTDNMGEAVAQRLSAQGIVPLSGIDDGLAGLQAALTVGRAWTRLDYQSLLKNQPLRRDASLTLLDEAESKQLLAYHGVPVPQSAIAHSSAEAAAVAERLGFPVVVKALGVAHKTDVGGVQLNLHSGQAVAAAVEQMSALSSSFLIEKMIGGCVAELIVGVARDEQFGAYLVLGAGGILVELLKDSRSLLLPVTKPQVLEALQSLKCAPLFAGFRGRPRADLEAAAEAILGIAEFVQEHADAIAELDINPLMLLAEGRGVVAADALIRMVRPD
ncbi:acetate--CoA ligase family protein [Pseudomonas lalucatii]|uniref:Acetate--CoA ligase family protein n=1 Tax=Pseudomonas lalucatii TaxID=1424203 RepID=A0ABS5Q3X2_9PSED|nr:acetate--CoA ligase family protein [Pseudomonas lalucatii]MBS7663275.1 acetate--CoA ligase family protein [Pseudomonas lalucatii]